MAEGSDNTCGRGQNLASRHTAPEILKHPDALPEALHWEMTGSNTLENPGSIRIDRGPGENYV